MHNNKQKGGEGRREKCRYFSWTDSHLKCPQQSGLSQTEPRARNSRFFQSSMWVVGNKAYEPSSAVFHSPSRKV